jgi:hypothetical protein
MLLKSGTGRLFFFAICVMTTRASSIRPCCISQRGDSRTMLKIFVSI